MTVVLNLLHLDVMLHHARAFINFYFTLTAVMSYSKTAMINLFYE